MELNMAATQGELSKAMSDGGAEDSADLTQDNFMQFAMWNFSLMQMGQATHYLYEQGLLDPSLHETEIRRAAGHLTLPGVRQFWDAGLKTQLTPEFVELIESTDGGGITKWDWDNERGFFAMEDPQN